VSRYRFIDEHRDRYPVATLTRTLGVSRSGYYDWRERPISTRAAHRAELAEHVHATFIEFDGIYGSRKIAEELVERRVRICRNTVAGLMRTMNLRSTVQRRRSFIATTDSDHQEPIAPNLLARDFTASEPNRKWVADLTYVPTDEGWAYVAVVMDLFSRRIVGWAVGDSLETSLVLEALNRAIETRRPRPDSIVHHSDRGSQYASADYRARLAEMGISCSMSRKGNCWDNASMERFMNSYKNEWTNHRRYANVEAVHRSTFEYIEIFYNRTRRHQALDYLSPAAFEDRHHTRSKSPNAA
jgi:transposase InsO family protein